MKAYVSLWSADLLNVGFDMDRVDEVADGYHIDITDGHFTKELLFGPDFVSAVRKRTEKVIDVHLMVTDADSWIPRFLDAGADMVTIHRKSSPDVLATLDSIRTAGATPSLALEVGEVVPDGASAEWPHVGRLLLMGTAIGIKGVEPDEHIFERVAQAAAARAVANQDAEVFVDGGIREHTVGPMALAGADGVIPGSLVYAVDDAIASIRHLHSLRAAPSSAGL